jgi:hypothetical protein
LPKLQAIPFHEFVIGSSITPPSFLESYLDMGLLFFGSTGAVMIAITLVEKLDIKVNSKAVMFLLQLFVWVGLGYLLVQKNPIWNWL